MDWASHCTVTSGVPSLNCIPYVFFLIINGLLAFGGTFAVYYIIMASIKLVISQGDAKELDTSHKTLFYAILGLLIILTSFLLVNLVGNITGVTCINQFGFTNCAAGKNSHTP